MNVLISPGLRILDGKILVDGIGRTFSLDPAISKTCLTLPEPSLEDQTSDYDRIVRILGFENGTPPEIDIELLRKLPEILHRGENNITVTISHEKIIDIQAGDTTAQIYGMAFDIGTTTVVGTLIDLTDGRELSYASRLNTQVVYGEDTISRINYVIQNPDGGHEMSGKIHSVMNEIIREAVAKAGINPENIYEVCCVGNTTMSHLFLGLDPAGLSKIPFVPVTSSAVSIRAAEITDEINPRGSICFLPNIAGFVGSDTVAVMLAGDYLEPGPVKLAVDVGTNGELALRHDGSLTVCSTAAGPALEGAMLTCGMRAAPGAIEHVRMNFDSFGCDVIGDTEPAGICGSGIIDLIAELLETGIIDQNGAFVSGDELSEHLSDDMFARMITVQDQPAFLIILVRREGYGQP